MKRSLLPYLACPVCLGDLTLSVREEAEGEVMEGGLACAACRCSYPITRFVPRCLPAQRTHLDAQTALIQDMTKASFGFEWTTHDRYGWDDPYYNVAKEKKTFHQKTLYDEKELAGKLVLDGGCGNGRYLNQALACGAEVVGVDLTDAAEAAYRNNRRNPRAHVLQADLFRLPFKPGVFDFAFSIGVLMHTGDARRAFQSIVRTVKAGGCVAVRLYGKENPVFEFNDRFLRALTIRIPAPVLEEWSELGARISWLLRRIGLYRLIRPFVFIHRDPVIVYDWYSAPIATHHTDREVAGWFNDLGLQEHRFEGEEAKGGLIRRFFRPPAVTARARRPALAR